MKEDELFHAKLPRSKGAWKNTPYWVKNRIQTLRQIARREDRSTAGLVLSYVINKFIGGATFYHFTILHLYRYSYHKRKTFLVARRAQRLQTKYFDVNATMDDIRVLWYKERFDRTFQPFIRREWLYTPDSSPEEIRAFIGRHPVFLAKEPDGSHGAGVALRRREELDTDAFIAECRSGRLLLEEYIVQHPAMAALNPTSVNTVRIATARYEGRVMPVGACLRVGGAGAHLDNFHSGGCAYPLDIKTGIVTGPGMDHADNEYLCHPSTGHIMPGFQVPHWDELLDTVCRAALIPPRIGWIGWDVAILPDGVELIEGNARHDPTVIQLGGHGVVEELDAFLRR